ncbi:MAG TPA: hypothetical protein VF532_02725 [Candidatus Angelobacter sp.]
MNSNPPFTIVSGNWEIALFPPSFPAGVAMLADGAISQSGNALSGIIHLRGSACFDTNLDDLMVSGTVAGSTLTLNTASLRGQVLSVIAMPDPNRPGGVNALSGTWSLTGGTCANSGNSLMIFVPPISGTWAGPLANGLAGTAKATLTQTGPDAHGFFQVSGSFVFSGSACLASGSVTSGTVSGLLGDILLNTNGAGQTHVTLVHDTGPPIESLFTGFAILSGTCPGVAGEATLIKQ